MIWLNATAKPVEPWISWEYTHYNFSRVGQYPGVVWTQDYLYVVAVQLSRWLVVVCALIFFAFFGFATEARKNYRSAFWALAILFGIRHSGSVPLDNARYAHCSLHLYPSIYLILTFVALHDKIECHKSYLMAHYPCM